MRFTNIDQSPFGSLINEYLKSGDESIFIISPFINEDTLLKITEDISTRDVSIVTSWRSDHLRSGYSSLSLYDLCKKNGWTLYINSRLHAKIYSKSFNSCFIGSANCTNNALYNPEGNIETLFFIDELKAGNRVELNKIIATSLFVDHRVHQQYVDWFEIVSTDSTSILPDPDIADVTPFYVYQLPAVSSPAIMWEYMNDPSRYYEQRDIIEHDLAIYSSTWNHTRSYDEFIKDVRSNFLKHPFISLIEKEITPAGMRFGYFKELIQKSCVDVPVPFRKDLTEMVQNLYAWFVELFPEQYYFDVPGRRSQVLHRVV